MTLTIPSLQKILCLHLAKSFWNESFKSEELQLNEIKNDRERKWEVRLTSYREKAICNLYAFTEKRKYPTLLKTILTEGIFLLHQAYHQVVLWKLQYDSDNKIDLLQAGELYAPNYFTVDGDFNDFGWAKHFVLHSSYPTARRFSLASFYWFENECCILWEQLENFEDIPAEDGFDFLGLFKNEFRQLKSRFEHIKIQLIRNESRREHFLRRQFNNLPDLFEISARKGFEHAVYFFWQRMSDAEKMNTILNENYFDIICRGFEYPRSKISNFLYSQLSEQRKELFLQWSIHYDISEIWLTLFLPPFIKEVHPEILKSIHQLPICMLSNLLNLLSHRIKQLKLPLDFEIFQLLWRKLSSDKKRYVVEHGPFLIGNMVKAKSFYNLEYILKCLSLEEKENCLLNGWCEAGIDSIEFLCSEGEFDLLQKYLSYFLFDMDLYNSRKILNKDAILLLQNFIKSPQFVRWYNNLSEFQQKEVRVRTDSLQTSATLLHELCEKFSE